MGSPVSEAGRDADEGPVHRVRISQAFYLGKYEVTVGEFRRFVAETGYHTTAEQHAEQGCRTLENPTRNKWGWTANRTWQDLEYKVEAHQPVVCVSWHDAQAYVRWLREATGEEYRLPTEAEWEYAARAGTQTGYHFGDKAVEICQYGNVADTTQLPNGNVWSNRVDCNDGHVYSAPVGSYRPNRWGLYDVHGNVWEWVQDCWNSSYAGAPGDGQAWETGNCSRRVLRGGSWSSVPRVLRSAFRFRYTADNRGSSYGFRIARSLP